jgi:hypothetical protein
MHALVPESGAELLEHRELLLQVLKVELVILLDSYSKVDGKVVTFDELLDVLELVELRE